MKKRLICACLCLCALLYASCPALAASPLVGGSGEYTVLNDALYYTCKEGLYRMQGHEKRLVCAFEGKYYSGLLTDGETAYAADYSGDACTLLKIDIRTGSRETIARFPIDIGRLAGLDNEYVYYVDFSGHNSPVLMALSLTNAKAAPFQVLNDVGETGFFDGACFVLGRQYDPTAEKLSAVQLENGTHYVYTIDPATMDFRVTETGVYFLSTNAEEQEGNFDTVSVCFTNGSGIEKRFQVNVGECGVIDSALLHNTAVFSVNELGKVFAGNWETGAYFWLDSAEAGVYSLYQDEKTGQLYSLPWNASAIRRISAGGEFSEELAFPKKSGLETVIGGVGYAYDYKADSFTAIPMP